MSELIVPPYQGDQLQGQEPRALYGGGLQANLNPQQRAAVTHAHEGPLLVIAGAGSGKTNTLAHRVAHLIAGGADPREILLLTFSRRAAAEMTRRVERIIACSTGARLATAT